MLTLLLAFQVAAGPVSGGEATLETIRNYVRISDRLATSGQIDTNHIRVIGAEGFDVVVNLAPPRAEMNGHEPLAVAEQGVTYINIPVDWNAPTLEDLDLFFGVMEANRDRKVFVHCFANMRASAFTYLYRTLVAGEDEAAARADMLQVWDPTADDRVSHWAELIEAARQRGR